MGTRQNLKLFPYLENKNLVQKLKIDKESLHYISHREHANQITDIVIKHLTKIGINPDDVTMVDATAGVGGNTIPFAQKFKRVYGIEIEKLRTNYLKNNLAIFNLKNTVVINDDCLKVLNNITDHNVVFIDPPWGGKNYKKFKSLKLKLGDLPLETICLNLLNPKMMTKLPELIVLKLPNNYDVKYFYNLLKGYPVYFYDLKKMFILVVENKSNTN